MTKSKVLEKIEYEQKLKRQCVRRRAISAILLIMLNILYAIYEVNWLEMSIEVNWLEMSIEMNWLEMSIWWTLVAFFFWAVMLAASWIVFILLSNHFGEQCDDKMDEFNSKLEEEKLVQYLGERKMKLHLQLGDMEEEFSQVVMNPKIKWYVQRCGNHFFRVTAYKGSKMVWTKVVEYEFIDSHFKVTYSK